MNMNLRNAAVAAAVSLTLVSLPRVAAAAEIDELRAAVVALQKRIEQLESRAQGAEETNAKQTEQIASASKASPAWVSNITWKGDLRYRYENTDQQYSAERNRQRIRARAGLVAKVNDTVRSEFALATTEGNDPRASNQTLTGENSRKAISLDLAYVEWAPNADWKLFAGKMRFPLIRPGQGIFIDGDVNPEGIAATWTHGDFFAATMYNFLEERSAARESTLVAGQVAWRPKLGAGKLSVGTSYYAYNGVRGRNPFHGGASNGNSTTSVALDCISAAPCLVNDYDLLELFAEWSQPVGGRPLTVYADYYSNTAASDMDTAWSAGVTWGKASDPRTWEVSYSYQVAGKDAIWGQFADSDFAAGLTDSQGSVIRAGFAPARNWVINGSYFLNETNVDVPVTITGVGAVQKRDVRRLQLDLNYKY